MPIDNITTLTLSPLEGTINVIELDSTKGQAFIAQDIVFFNDGYSGIILNITDIITSVKRLNLPGLATDASLTINNPVRSGAFDNSTGFLYLATNTNPIEIIKIQGSPLQIETSNALTSGPETPESMVIDKANQKIYISARDASNFGIILKIDISTLTIESSISSGVATDIKLAIDESRGFLYAQEQKTSGKVYKIDLSTFTTITSPVRVTSGEGRAIAIDISRNILYIGNYASSSKITVYKVDADTMTTILSRQITEFTTGGNSTKTITVNESYNVIYVTTTTSGFLGDLYGTLITRINGDDLTSTIITDFNNVPGGTITRDAIIHNNNLYVANSAGYFNNGTGNVVKFSDDGFNFIQTKERKFDFGDLVATDLMIIGDKLYCGGNTGTITQINLKRFTKIKNTTLQGLASLCFEATGYATNNSSIYSSLLEFDGNAYLSKITPETLEFEKVANLTTIAGLDLQVSIKGLLIKDGFLYGGSSSGILGGAPATTNIIKINLNNNSFVNSVSIDSSVSVLGGFLGKTPHLYFIGDTSPAKLYKVSSNPLSLISTLTLPVGLTFDIFANASYDRKQNKAYLFPNEAAAIIKVDLPTMTIDDVLTFTDSRFSASGFVDVKNRKLYVFRLNTLTEPSVITEINLNNFTVMNETEVDTNELYAAIFDENCGIGYFASFNGPINILKVQVSEGNVTVSEDSNICKTNELSCRCDQNNEIRCTPPLDIRRGCNIGAIVREDCKGQQPKTGVIPNIGTSRSDSALLPPITLCNQKLNIKKSCKTTNVQEDKCKTR